MQDWLEVMQEKGLMSEEDFEKYLELESDRPTAMSSVQHQLRCLEEVGYGIAPDPRFVPWLGSNFNPTYFYQVDEDSLTIWDHQYTKSHILEIALAVIALKENGKLSSLAKKDLEKTIENRFRYRTISIERLIAHLHWFSQDSTNTSLISAISQSFINEKYGPTRYNTDFENFAAYTIINGFVHRDKIQVIENIYVEANYKVIKYYNKLNFFTKIASEETLPKYLKNLTKKTVEFRLHDRQKEYQGWQRVKKVTINHSEKNPSERLSVDRSESIQRREKSKILKWFPKNTVVNFAGRRIKGMIYIGKHSKLREFDQFYCSACIDPSLKVGKPLTKKDTSAWPDNPSYLLVDSRIRASFLDWLETDRADNRYSAGFSKLYWYGLEYRFFVDNPSDKEKREILSEARRIIEVYDKEDSDFLGLRNFIDYASVLIGDDDLIPTTVSSKRKSLFPTLIVIGRLIAKGKQIPAEWCLSWYLNLPDTQVNYTMMRMPDEFILYYKYLFNKKFSTGFKVTGAKGKFTSVYISSSKEFSQELEFILDGVPLPDVNKLEKPINEIKSIVKEVTIGLKSYDRYVSKNEDKKYSLEAIGRLPKALEGDRWSERLKKLIETMTEEERNEGLFLRNLLERLEGFKRDKLTLRQFAETSQVLGYVGYGISPDPRLLSRAPKLEEKVLIFPVDDRKDGMHKLSETLLNKIVDLEIEVWLRTSDGNNEQSVEDTIKRQIESLTDLDIRERRVLLSNLKWFLSYSIDIKKYRKWFGELSVVRKEDLRRKTLSICRSFGDGLSKAITRLETIYSLMGYQPQQVFSDVYAGEAIDGPILVRDAKVGPKGEPIPKDREDHETVSLDTEKVDSLVDETDQVRAILGGVFADDVQFDQDQSKNVSTAPNFSKGLDRKHAALVTDFLSKERWTASAIEKLAGEHGLMWQGSLEVINEWSFDLCEEELIEEYNGFRANPNTLEKLKELILPREKQ